MNELWLFVNGIIEGRDPQSFEKLDDLKDEIETEISSVFQNYSDEHFEGQSI